MLLLETEYISMNTCMHVYPWVQRAELFALIGYFFFLFFSLQTHLSFLHLIGSTKPTNSNINAFSGPWKFWRRWQGNSELWRLLMALFCSERGRHWWFAYPQTRYFPFLPLLTEPWFWGGSHASISRRWIMIDLRQSGQPCFSSPVVHLAMPMWPSSGW